MKKYKAILFDMDGTLLPMDMNEFTSGYFKLLCKRLAPFGFDADILVKVIWKSVGAMVVNDGKINNEAVFWKTFGEILHTETDQIKPICDDFYGKEFVEAKCFTKDNPLATLAVKTAHEKAPIVALATNPLFPMPGQVTRMSWVGLKPSDFDLVTSYESDYYCKPNPKYYEAVCERLGVKPTECLMIGNDELEDMYSCSQLGIDGYLVTDTMIESKEHPWDGPRGTFAELIEMLKNL